MITLLFLAATHSLTPLDLDSLPTPTPSALGWWMICGAAVMLMLERGINLFQRLRGTVVYVDLTRFQASMDGINQRFSERCDAIEERIENQVVATDKYLHEFRHELRSELQSVTLKGDEREQRIFAKLDAQAGITGSSVGKVHQRVDALASLMGELKGEMKHVASAITHARE